MKFLVSLLLLLTLTSNSFAQIIPAVPKKAQEQEESEDKPKFKKSEFYFEIDGTPVYGVVGLCKDFGVKGAYEQECLAFDFEQFIITGYKPKEIKWHGFEYIKLLKKQTFKTVLLIWLPIKV